MKDTLFWNKTFSYFFLVIKIVFINYDSWNCSWSWFFFTGRFCPSISQKNPMLPTTPLADRKLMLKLASQECIVRANAPKSFFELTKMSIKKLQIFPKNFHWTTRCRGRALFGQREIDGQLGLTRMYREGKCTNYFELITMSLKKLQIFPKYPAPKNFHWTTRCKGRAFFFI